MDKKQRYINYIVDDLLKNTDIDYKQGYIKFYPLHPLLRIPFSSVLPYPRTKEYIITRYGVLDDEVKIIWQLYKERIEKLIDNG